MVGFTRHMKDKHTTTVTSSDETDDKFQCDVCNKTFISEKYLNGHKASHKSRPQTKSKPYPDSSMTEEETFKCSECGKTFGYRSSLKRHMANHKRNKVKCVTQNTCILQWNSFQYFFIKTGHCRTVVEHSTRTV